MSAKETAEACRDELLRNCVTVGEMNHVIQKHIEAHTAELRAENERLRAALEPYAENYNWSVPAGYKSECLWMGDSEHGYEIAQAALKGGE